MSKLTKTDPIWAQLLRQNLSESMKQNKDSISYPLATIDQHSSPISPRVRFVVHRGFANERRQDGDGSSNPIDDGAGNPLVGQTLLSTTDVRGPKGEQLVENGSTEIAWWLEPTKHQFRIRSHAFLLPPPGHPLKDKFPSERLAPFDGFDWEQERLRVFRKMSPPLRASFVRPIPGTPLDQGEGSDPATYPKELPTDLEAKTDKDKELVKQALEHLALIVLEPYSVDV